LGRASRLALLELPGLAAAVSDAAGLMLAGLALGLGAGLGAGLGPAVL
jgi:hypothetical protein